MQYILYVLAAYTVTFVILGWMFVTSYRKYLSKKAEFKEVTKEQSQPQ